MAGTAAYGDILENLQTEQRLLLSHCLESAKILPPPPDANPKRLWGYYTFQGITRAEIQAPNRKRVVCMAVTSREELTRGRPSSWSGQIDELASGYSDGMQRLLILSAGNIDEPQEWLNYPDSNKTNEVHDPAQAWNALSVGAFTKKTRIVDPMLTDYQAIADTGLVSDGGATVPDSSVKNFSE
jgi:Subtilase family